MWRAELDRSSRVAIGAAACGRWLHRVASRSIPCSCGMMRGASDQASHHPTSSSASARAHGGGRGIAPSETQADFHRWAAPLFGSAVFFFFVNGAHRHAELWRPPAAHTVSVCKHVASSPRQPRRPARRRRRHHVRPDRGRLGTGLDDERGSALALHAHDRRARPEEEGECGEDFYDHLVPPAPRLYHLRRLSHSLGLSTLHLSRFCSPGRAVPGHPRAHVGFPRSRI